MATEQLARPPATGAPTYAMAPTGLSRQDRRVALADIEAALVRGNGERWPDRAHIELLLWLVETHGASVWSCLWCREWHLDGDNVFCDQHCTDAYAAWVDERRTERYPLSFGAAVARWQQQRRAVAA